MRLAPSSAQTSKPAGEGKNRRARGPHAGFLRNPAVAPAAGTARVKAGNFRSY